MVAINDEVIGFYFAADFQELHRDNAVHGMQLHSGFEFSAFDPAISGNPEQVSSTGFQVVLAVVNLNCFTGCEWLCG